LNKKVGGKGRIFKDTGDDYGPTGSKPCKPVPDEKGCCFKQKLVFISSFQPKYSIDLPPKPRPQILKPDRRPPQQKPKEENLPAKKDRPEQREKSDNVPGASGFPTNKNQPKNAEVKRERLVNNAKREPKPSKYKVLTLNF